MPNCESLTIKESIQDIANGRYYLPAIQRKFVWSHDQIERLFDSIMRDYPIGTFLFWKVHDDTRNNYVFYKVIQEYSEFDRWRNERGPNPELTGDITGVLDGQQRLNSLFVALQGSYAYRAKRARKDDPASYPKREFHLNVFHEPDLSDDENDVYQFRFLTKSQADRANTRSDQCWFPVKRLMQCAEASNVMDAWDDHVSTVPDPTLLTPDLHKTARNMLIRLWNRLTNQQIINYFPVYNQDLDEILDIFVRVNSAGKVLSKTDLLFSTIVAHWEDGRSRIEEFIAELNSIGNGFQFDTDFMMRACLVLTNGPVRLRVASFKQENVDRIVDQWESIQNSLRQAAILLAKWGVDGEKFKANNAAIPVALAVQLGFDLKKSETDLRLFFIKSLLTSLYGYHADQVLADLRTGLREAVAKSKRFDLAAFESSAKLPQGKTLAIEKADIEDLLDTEKGARTFLILSLLYPTLDFSQVQFHQDHIHPRSRFWQQRLQSLELSENEISSWQSLRDTLPNLQLLEGTENQSKSNLPFQDWMDSHFPETPEGTPHPERGEYFRRHFIPKDASLNILHFPAFYDARRQLLKAELSRILKITAADSSPS
jgi:hypothetical protein